MSRTTAREIAMKYIYSIDMNKIWNEDREALNNESEFIEHFVHKDEMLTEEDIEYMNGIISGLTKNLEEVDSLIEKNSKTWKLNRFSKIDLSILRLAVYEILYEDDIPHKVSINEAVKLAKKFGSDESSKFINGILGGIVRGMDIS